MKKEKTKILKEKYAGSFGGKRDKPDQPNLFGDQDFVFSALQEELSVIHSMIERTIESIDKKKELLDDLKRRKQQLDKAAVMVKDAKHFLKEKKKEEKVASF